MGALELARATTRALSVLLREGGAGAFALNVNGTHWVVVFIDGGRKCIGFADPLGGRVDGALKFLLQRATQLTGVEWSSDWGLGLDAAGNPFQQDPYPPGPFQCGVWELFFEELFLRFLAEAPPDAVFGDYLKQNIVGDYSALIATKRLEYRGVLAAYKAAHPSENYDDA